MRFGLLVALLLGAGLLLNGPVWAAGKGKGKDKGKGNDELVEKGKDKAKGHGKKDGDRPPGWDKGKKKGWHDEYPPGWSKKSDKEKAKWKTDVEDAKDQVGKAADAKGVTAKEKDHEGQRNRRRSRRLARHGRDSGYAVPRPENAHARGSRT
jgi:hypothetical protein